MKVNNLKQRWNDYYRYTLFGDHCMVNINVDDCLDNEVAYISDLYVEEEYRGQGKGKSLFKYAIRYIRNTLGIKTIVLSCSKENPIYNFYLKFGFRKTNLDQNGYYLMAKFY